MLNKRIARQLIRNLLLTFLLGSLVTALSLSLFYEDKTGSIEGNSGLIIIVLAGVVWNLILTLSSLTVFLNLDNRIRENKLASMLTFFLLPVLIPICVFVYSNNDFKDMWQPFLIMTLSFLLTQAYFCFKFLEHKF